MLTIVKKNDSYDAITYQLENEDNSTVDLTGASVNFVMGKKNKLITNAKATVTSATSGIVSYQLTPSDTLVSGTFLAEFVVTFANGTTKTYPSNGYITVDVEQNLDTSQNNVVLDMIATKQGDFEAKLDSILKQGTGTQVSAMNEYTWTATSGQTIFIFPTSAKYDPSAKWFQVSVGNVPIANELINRASSSQFSLVVDPSLIVAGMTVHAMWVEPIVPITGGHHSTHEINGQDEINIANLRNYQELVATPLAEKAKQSDLVYVNVKNPPAPLLGAKGDGSTDDTTAINNLFSNSVNRYFYFPEGTYMVEYTYFGKGVHLLGDGFDKTIIKRKNSYNTTTFDTSQPKKGNLLGNVMYDYSTKENVSIEGVCFDGNVSTAVMNTSALLNMFNNVHLHYLGNLFIKSCKFINSIGDGLFLGGIDNAVIDSCYFEHIGYNISSSASSRNGISTFGTYYNNSLSQNILKESNTLVRNCFFKDSADMGIVTRNPKTLTVEGCEFNSIANGSLELYGDALSSGTLNNTFETKFVIKNNMFLSGSISHGDPNKNYKEIFIFENNLVKSSQKTILIAGNGTSDFTAYVKNNVFEIDQLNFTSINKVFLQNNDIKFLNVTGVFFGSCPFPTVSENNFFYTGTATNTMALNFYNTTTEPIVINNLFSTNTASTSQCILFNFTDGTTLKIENMRIIGNKISGYNRGINISSAVNNTILINSNVIDVPTTGGEYCIYQWSGVACKKAVVFGNVFINNASVTLNATSAKVDTKGSGTNNINAGSTGVAVTHGLGYSPTVITVTPQANIGSVWVTGITSSQFVINCSTAAASLTAVSWRAS